MEVNVTHENKLAFVLVVIFWGQLHVFLVYTFANLCFVVKFYDRAALNCSVLFDIIVTKYMLPSFDDQHSSSRNCFVRGYVIHNV